MITCARWRSRVVDKLGLQRTRTSWGWQVKDEKAAAAGAAGARTRSGALQSRIQRGAGQGLARGAHRRGGRGPRARGAARQRGGRRVHGGEPGAEAAHHGRRATAWLEEPAGRAGARSRRRASWRSIDFKKDADMLSTSLEYAAEHASASGINLQPDAHRGAHAHRRAAGARGRHPAAAQGGRRRRDVGRSGARRAERRAHPGLEDPLRRAERRVRGAAASATWRSTRS